MPVSRSTEATLTGGLSDPGICGISKFSTRLNMDLMSRKLTEATSNSVRHAYAEDGDGVVEISYELLEDKLVIEVTDEGAGFDPDEAGGAPEELSEGGLGIAIIRAIADEVEIKTRPGGKGSQLRFEKALA